MIEPFEFVLVALASWRLAYLLTNEAGPANVVGTFRHDIGGDDSAP